MLDLIKWIIVSSRSFTAIRCKWMPWREQNKHRIDMHIRGVLIYVLLRWLILFERQGERNNGSAREGRISVFQISLNSQMFRSNLWSARNVLQVDDFAQFSNYFFKTGVLWTLKVNTRVECLYWSVTHEFNNKKCLVMQAFLNLRIEFRVFTTTVVQIESAKIK